MDKITADCEDKMKKCLDALDKELSRVRVGRANLNILDGIKVSYYGALTPLSQVASLSTPDARTIVISPFEKKILKKLREGNIQRLKNSHSNNGGDKNREQRMPHPMKGGELLENERN